MTYYIGNIVLAESEDDIMNHLTGLHVDLQSVTSELYKVWIEYIGQEDSRETPRTVKELEDIIIKYIDDNSIESLGFNVEVKQVM